MRPRYRGRRSRIPHRQRHPGRRHRTWRQPDRAVGSAAGDVARTGRVRHRTHRLIQRATFATIAVLQLLRPKELHAMTIHDPSLRAALKTLKLTGMLDTL